MAGLDGLAAAAAGAFAACRLRRGGLLLVVGLRAVSHGNRQEYLHGTRNRDEKTTLTPRFITDYSAFDAFVHANVVLRRAIDRHRDKPCVNALFGKDDSIDVVYRGNKSLAGHLVRAAD